MRVLLMGNENKPMPSVEESDSIVLSVYFSGTAHNLSTDYLAGLMFAYDRGLKLDDTDREPVLDNSLFAQYKMGFLGCGIEYGLAGGIFGTGLEEQCQKVVAEVKRLRGLIAEKKLKKRIVVNCYGHSRGGIGGLILAKMLGVYPLDMVEMNLAMLDPVPGNLITSAECDLFNLTLANQVIDLSMCHNLKRVICLYPNEPLPDIIFHAPIRPTYPPLTLVEEDVVLGCHAAVEQIFGMNSPDWDDKGQSYVFAAPRFIEFMQECGSQFKSSFFELYIKSKNLFNTHNKAVPELNLSTYQKLLADNDGNLLPPEETVITRDYHAQPSNGSTMEFKRPVKPDEYINLHHKSLVTNETIEKARITVPEIIPDAKTLNALKKMASLIYKNMSPASQSAKKGMLLIQLMEKFDIQMEDNPDLDENQTSEFIQTYFRLLINITLQRDRYDCKFFSISSTTQSGEYLKRLLMNREYHYFAYRVLGTANHALKYRDLRSYAGGYDEEHFNEKNRDDGYVKINNAIDELDNLFKREQASSSKTAI